MQIYLIKTGSGPIIPSRHRMAGHRSEPVGFKKSKIVRIFASILLRIVADYHGGRSRLRSQQPSNNDAKGLFGIGRAMASTLG
jgi:hypothetical protein